MEDFEREMKLTFIDEASQLLDDVEQCFLRLEDNPHDKETLERIFRLAHNLKGSAKAVGFDDVNKFCHEFENFLIAVKKGEVSVDAAIVSLLLNSADHIKTMINGLRDNFDARFDSSAILSEIAAARTRTPAAPTNSAPQETGGLQLFDETPAPSAENNQWEEEQSSTPETEQEPAQVEEEPAHHDASDAPVIPLHAQTSDASYDAQKKATSGTAHVDDNIRVSLGRLERLIDAVGEMVILQSVIQQMVAESSSPSLRRTTHQMSKVIKEIQDMSMSLRMVKLKPVFQKMNRIVRDTSAILSKDVRLVTSGDETEVDKTVFEKIGDPLVHLIRNAVDHGLENSEDRTAAGKNAEGIIHLRAFHQGGKLVLEIEDDGRGIDGEKLRQIAVQKGLISPDRKLSESEARELVFLPGFSSKKEVTDVSGRGVGMDVVKTNLQELGGSINILSEIGKGTTFRIELPLTLAIIDGMIVRAGTERFIVPLSHVHETVRLDKNGLQHSSGLGEVLFLREENVPLYRLGRIMGVKRQTEQEQETCAIVVRTKKNVFCIAIDEIIASSQVVVKQLGKEVANSKGISGSTILGDGRPALILELTELVHQHGHLTSAQRRAA